jgi:hypothetical protein
MIATPFPRGATLSGSEPDAGFMVLQTFEPFGFLLNRPCALWLVCPQGVNLSVLAAWQQGWGKITAQALEIEGHLRQSTESLNQTNQRFRQVRWCMGLTEKNRPTQISGCGKFTDGYVFYGLRCFLLTQWRYKRHIHTSSLQTRTIGGLLLHPTLKPALRSSQ